MKAWTVLPAIAGLVLSGSVCANTFEGDQCSDDCSGHQAGFDWAQHHQIDDEASCDTPSSAFNEGCSAYVRGGAGAVQTDDDEDDDSDEDDA